MRTHNKDVEFSAYKGNFFFYAIIAYGALTVACHVLADVLKIFPIFK